MFGEVALLRSALFPNARRAFWFELRSSQNELACAFSERISAVIELRFSVV